MANLATAAGTPQRAGVTSPVLYSARWNIAFYKTTILNEICNTNWEQELFKMGSSIKIRNLSTPQIFTGVKNQRELQLTIPEQTNTTLDIDKYKYFYIGADEVDIMQADIDFMNAEIQNHNNQLKVDVENGLLADIPADVSAYLTGNTGGAISGIYTLGVTTVPVEFTKFNALDILSWAEAAMDESNVPSDDRWFTLPAIGKSQLNLSELASASYSGDSVSVLRQSKGALSRKVCGFTVYYSNNIPSSTVGGVVEYSCLFGHKSAVTFAGQIDQIKRGPYGTNPFIDTYAYRFVYGYKVVKAAALGMVVAKFNLS